MFYNKEKLFVVRLAYVYEVKLFTYTRYVTYKHLYIAEGNIRDYGDSTYKIIRSNNKLTGNHNNAYQGDFFVKVAVPLIEYFKGEMPKYLATKPILKLEDELNEKFGIKDQGENILDI
ncbi:MAG: hypothetical protein PHS54_04920 [Clostridia bacterium]|nr:hypothetical protein [Clostridia bacterium]